MPKGDKPAQDWSGHVSLNTQQCNFFHEVNRKTNRIERQREYGQLKQKPTRNPLRAEKTPRINYNGFDYFPPPAKSVEEKWVYPESDWGLMAKFQSQKHIYDDIIATEKDYAHRLEECMRIKARNEQMLSDELHKQQHAREIAEEKAAHDLMRSLGQVVPPTARSIQPGGGGGGTSARGTAGRDTARTTYSAREGSVIPEEDQDELDFMNMSSSSGRNSNGTDHGRGGGGASSSSSSRGPRGAGRGHHYYTGSSGNETVVVKMSAIKELGGTHPEVLAKLRADRAAEFVALAEKQQHVDPSRPPPPGRALTGRAFKPAGLFDETRNKSIVADNDEKKAQRARETQTLRQQAARSAAQPLDVAALSRELAKTEEEIAKQKLNIALHAKTKGYQTHTNSKVMK